MLYSLRVFGRDEVAQQRMKIIKFYEQYGEEETEGRRSFSAKKTVSGSTYWCKRTSSAMDTKSILSV
jgi:hypothetical protein